MAKRYKKPMLVFIIPTKLLQQTHLGQACRILALISSTKLMPFGSDTDTIIPFVLNRKSISTMPFESNSIMPFESSSIMPFGLSSIMPFESNTIIPFVSNMKMILFLIYSMIISRKLPISSKSSSIMPFESNTILPFVLSMRVPVGYLILPNSCFRRRPP